MKYIVIFERKWRDESKPPVIDGPYECDSLTELKKVINDQLDDVYRGEGERSVQIRNLSEIED